MTELSGNRIPDQALAKAGKKIPVDNRPIRGVSLGITLEVPATA